MMNVWSSLKLIDSRKLLAMQQAVDSFVTPSDVGRIPSKIASGFSGFTAEQWRNWTILSALKDVLPRELAGTYLLERVIFCAAARSKR